MERELPAAVKCKKYPPHLSVPFQAEAWRVCYFNYTRSTLNCSYFQVSLPTMCSWLRQAQPPDPGLPNGFDRARSLPWVDTPPLASLDHRSPCGRGRKIRRVGPYATMSNRRGGFAGPPAFVAILSVTRSHYPCWKAPFGWKTGAIIVMWRPVVTLHARE